MYTRHTHAHMTCMDKQRQTLNHKHSDGTMWIAHVQ